MNRYIDKQVDKILLDIDIYIDIDIMIRTNE